MRILRPSARPAAAAGPADDPRGWRFAAAILLAAVNLRPAVASVGPVLADIRTDLGLSAATASLLTALPVLCFGAGALAAPRLVRRFGSDATMAAVMVLTTAGLVVRLGPTPATLLAGTFLAGAAIAVANVLIPAMVKRHFPHRAGLMMGLYVSVLGVAAAIAAAVTVPIAAASSAGWRAGLGVWAAPAALAALLWLAVIVRGRRRAVPAGGTREVPTSLLTDPVAWRVTIYMGLQSLGFYTLLSWLPSLYRSAGMSPEAAGALLSLVVVLGGPIALFVPSLLTRAAQQSTWAVCSVALIGVGLLGLLLAPTALPVVWAVLLGVGLGSSFPLALTLVVLRSRTAAEAAQLSAMSQSVGYGLAAVGPYAFGILYDISGGWQVPLLMLLLLLVPQAIAGAGAGRPVHVGAGTQGR